MSSASGIPLHPRAQHTNPLQPSPNNNNNNPLPPLLQTPSGLALLELQGTINLPPFPPDTAPAPTASDGVSLASSSQPTIPIGRLHFPEYHPDSAAAGDNTWMKRVWMYVGEHQRLQGEVKKLPRALAVVRKRRSGKGEGGEGDGREREEELEVVEIVRYKVVFSSRPEPVGSGGVGLS